MGTAIVLIILLVVVSLVIRSIIKDKKNGKSITCGGVLQELSWVPLTKCSTYFIAKRLARAGLFVVAWFRERTGKAVESPGCECYNDSGK